MRFAEDSRTVQDWKEAHLRYLDREVFVPGDDLAIGLEMGVGAPDEMSETFRYGWEESPFTKTDPTRDLIRIAAIQGIAGLARSESVEDVRRIAVASLAGDVDALARMETILARAALNGDRGPVFAAFWDDVTDLIVDRAGRDVSTGETLHDS